jgi:hypothetical protein
MLLAVKLGGRFSNLGGKFCLLSCLPRRGGKQGCNGLFVAQCAVALSLWSKMSAVVRIGDIRSDLITFAVDDRPNFLGDQWLSLYLASDDQRYLVPTSFPAYTVIGKGVFMLATRFARGKERATSFVREVADFLIYVRRPLFRFLVYVGDLEDVERDGPRMRIPFVAPEVAFRGDEGVWGVLPLIDGVKTILLFR